MDLSDWLRTYLENLQNIAVLNNFKSVPFNQREFHRGPFCALTSLTFTLIDMIENLLPLSLA